MIFAGKTAPSTKGVLLGTGTKAEFAKNSDRSASFILWLNLVLKLTSPFLQEFRGGKLALSYSTIFWQTIESDL